MTDIDYEKETRKLPAARTDVEVVVEIGIGDFDNLDFDIAGTVENTVLKISMEAVEGEVVGEEKVEEK